MGEALLPALVSSGHEVFRLVRHAPGRERDIEWHSDSGELEIAADLPAADAIIHLAGENIAGQRWNERQKDRIRDSRVSATDLLCKTLLRCKLAPKVFISASAVGIYGNRGEEILTEESAPGTGFLAETCQGWEAASRQLEREGCRVVHLRFGMILSSHGGALAKMLPIFKTGLGGRVGNGHQYVSWISLKDAVRSMCFTLENPVACTAINIVSPKPVTNAEFTRALGSALHRPAVLPAPAPFLRFAFGEMADALLLASQRVVPRRLLDLGFLWEHPQLETALRWAIVEEEASRVQKTRRILATHG